MFLCTSLKPTVTNSTSYLGPVLGARDPLSRLAWFISMERECPSNRKTLSCCNQIIYLPFQRLLPVLLSCSGLPAICPCAPRVVLGYGNRQNIKTRKPWLQEVFLKESWSCSSHQRCGTAPGFPVTPRANIPAANIFLRNVYSGLNHECFTLESCCPVVIGQISCVALFLLDEWANTPNLSACLWTQVFDIWCTKTGKTNSVIRACFGRGLYTAQRKYHPPLDTAATKTTATVGEEGNKTYLEY